jgi:hypothetical protein
MKTTSLPSVDTQKFDTAMLKYLTFLNLKQAALENRPVTSTFPEFHTTRTAFNDLLTQDRHQAYTRLVEGIKAQVKDINGEGSVFDDFATDILENVVKPLYGKK